MGGVERREMETTMMMGMMGDSELRETGMGCLHLPFILLFLLL
jgi:hypothetical protein